MDGQPAAQGGVAALPATARGYLVVLVGLAAACVVVSAQTGAGPQAGLALLYVLLVLCAVGAGFEIFAPGHYALQPAFAFFVWGALLLPVWAIGLLALASFGPGLLLRRAEPYKATFNIANYVLAGSAAAAIAALLGGVDPVGGSASTLAVLLLGPLAATLVNHGTLLVMVVLATGERPARMLHQLFEGAPLSFGAALTGGCLAALWVVWPPMVIAGAGSVALIVRSLWVPMLRHKAETDPKTGLLNSETLYERFAEELEAARPNGPLAVVMVDLDHLRAINNRLGHLAGDRAIIGAADALAAALPQTGAAARFGGEEFCVLLPGCSPERAAEVLEQAREHLAELRLPEDPDLHVTFSAGIAGHPEHGTAIEELLAAADRAVYDAKASGRDRVRVALAEPSRAALGLEGGGALAAAADARLRRLAATSAPRAPTDSGVMRAVRIARRTGGRRAGDRAQEEIERENARLQHVLDAQGGLLTRLQNAQLETLAALGRVIDQRDPNAADRVATLSARLARALGLDEPDVARIELAATICDIGEAGIDRSDEVAVRRHTEIGTQLLADLEVPLLVRQVVRSHHERFDGEGYPDGLAGDDIPLAARIVAVADAYDAMLCERVHRTALSPRAALDEIVRHRGTQFCPRVVDSLLDLMGSGPQFQADVSDIRPNAPQRGVQRAP